MNYFEIFNLPIHLMLNEDELQKKFYALSKKTHPDLFSTAPASERKRMIDFYSTLNYAFKTLKNKTSRIHYVIDLLAEKKTNTIPPMFLMEMMEAKELYDDYKHNPTDITKRNFDQTIHNIKGIQEKLEHNLHDEMMAFDQTQTLDEQKKILQHIQVIVEKQKYIHSLLENISL